MTSPERCLWINVLLRAATDALYIGMDPRSLLCKAQAHAWICGNSDDFQHVCQMAGIEAEWFRYCYMHGRMTPAPKRGRQAAFLPDMWNPDEWLLTAASV